MNDYAKEPNIELDKSNDLASGIEALTTKKGITENYFQAVKNLVKDSEKSWNTDQLIYRLSDKITEIMQHTIKTYPVGNTFEELNHKDYNLIREGLITIGAEPSAGKTSLLTALSIDILQHNPDTALLFYSMDDSFYLSGKRILSQLSGKNLFYTDPQDFPPISEESWGILSRMVIKESLNIATLEREAEKVKELCGCTQIIIGIDYLQIITNIRETVQREFLNTVVKELKEIQKRQKCIVFLLSQLNRDTKSTGFRYRETSEIENQSDVCLDIIQGNDKETPDRTIKVSKNKLGLKGRSWNTRITAALNYTKLISWEETSGDYKQNEIQANDLL